MFFITFPSLVMDLVISSTKSNKKSRTYGIPQGVPVKVFFLNAKNLKWKCILYKSDFACNILEGILVHVNGYRIFPRSKEQLGRDADPSPLLGPWSRKSRAIPLLPLWAVRPVQSLSACTRVHFIFTYNSTPLIGRTACRGPQCLYRFALYLFLIGTHTEIN